MAKSLLSKSQSGVLALLYTLIFSFATSVAEAQPPMSNPMSGFGQSSCTPQNVDAFALKECKAEPPEGTDAASKNAHERWRLCYERVRKETCGGSTATGPCDLATKEWETARKEFQAACSAANVPSGGGKSGHFACSAKMQQCTHCDADADARPSGVECENSGDSDSYASDSTNKDNDLLNALSGRTTGGAIQMTPDINADRQRFAFCPSLAAADLKTWQDEYKDAKKTVEDLQNKITKLTEELDTIKSDADKKNVELQDKSEEVQANAEKSVKEIKEKLQDSQKQMAEDIEKLNGEIAKENAGLRQLDIGRVQAQTALADQISRLNLSCHTAALQRTENERIQRLKQMENSTYSAGDFNDLMSGVGLSSRQKNQLKVDEYYVQCQKDRSYTMAVDSAKKALEIANQQAAEGRRSINDRITTLNNKINTIKTTEANKDLQRAYDRMVEIQKIMDKELNKLNRDKMQSEQQFTRKYASKARELQQQQARLAEEEQYLKQKKQYLAMKTQMSKGTSSTTQDKVVDAMSKYTSLSYAAKRVAKDCCSGGSKAGICEQTNNYMIADDPDEFKRMNDVSKTTTAPSTQAAATGAGNPNPQNQPPRSPAAAPTTR